MYDLSKTMICQMMTSRKVYKYLVWIYKIAKKKQEEKEKK